MMTKTFQELIILSGDPECLSLLFLMQLLRIRASGLLQSLWPLVAGTT